MAIHYCGARKKSCRNCGHRFPKEEYDLWECPECGENRACRAPVEAEGKRCKYHGGMSLAGPAHGRWVDGRYSKILPRDIAERYETAKGDPELLAMRDEIALIDARMSELLETLPGGGGGALWQELSESYADLETALDAGDVERLTIAAESFYNILQRGQAASMTWVEVYSLIDQRRKVVESERKRLVQLQQMITAEQAMALMARVQAIIVENVDDRKAMSGIIRGIRSLVTTESG